MFGRKKKQKQAEEALMASQSETTASSETPGADLMDPDLQETTYIPNLSDMKDLGSINQEEPADQIEPELESTGTFQTPGNQDLMVQDLSQENEGPVEIQEERKVLSRSERKKLEKQRKKEAKQAEREARAQAKIEEEIFIENVQIKPRANETSAQAQARLERKRRGRRIRNRLKNFFLLVLIAGIGGLSYYTYNLYNQVLDLEQEKADQKTAYEMELEKRDQINRELSLGKEDLTKELEVKNETLEQQAEDIKALNTQIEEKNKMIESLAKNVQSVNDSFDALMKQVGNGSTQERLKNLENAIKIMNSDPNN